MTATRFRAQSKCRTDSWNAAKYMTHSLTSTSISVDFSDDSSLLAIFDNPAKKIEEYTKIPQLILGARTRGRCRFVK